MTSMPLHRPLLPRALAPLLALALVACATTEAPPAAPGPASPQTVPPPSAAPAAPAAHAPAPAPAPRAASAPPAHKSCALVVGGLVPEFADPKVAQGWWTMSEAVTQAIEKRLRERHRTAPLMIARQEQARVAPLVADALARNQCDRVIQIVTRVNEDSAGRFFQWDIALLRVEPRTDVPQSGPGVRAVTRGEYERSYRYSRTKEAFDAFRVSAFADRAVADLAAAGVLKPIVK